MLVTNKIDSVKNYRYVSEFIGGDYKQWGKGDIVFIDSQMGSGKSTFNIDVLSDSSQFSSNRILILVNRDRLLYHYQDKIKHKRNIKVMTYQKLEEMISHNGDDKLTDFKYIVADEAHYFLTDSWNKTTNISYDWIMSQNNSIRVFETATSDEFDPLLYEYIRKCKGEINAHYYCLQDDYSYFNIHPYTQNSIKIIDFLMATIDKENEKILFFTCKKQAGLELLEKYPDDVSVIFSKGSEEGKKFNTKEAIKDGKCISIITVATKCLDNGVSIEDSSVKYVVADLYEPIPLIQCLGRKRVNYRDEEGNQVHEDSVKVYIKDWTNKLGKAINVLEHSLQRINVKEKEILEGNLKVCPGSIRGIQDVLISYNKATQEAIYEKRVNTLYRENLRSTIELYKKLDGKVVTAYTVNEHHQVEEEYSYKNITWLEHIIKMLNGCNVLENDYRETLDDSRCKKSLEEYKERGEYSERFNRYEFSQEEYRTLIEDLNIVDSKGRIVKQISKVNAKLDINSIPYEINSRRKKYIDCETSKEIRSVVYWIADHEPTTDKFDIADCEFTQDVYK